MIYDACQLELAGILMLENVNKRQQQQHAHLRGIPPSSHGPSSYRPPPSSSGRGRRRRPAAPSSSPSSPASSRPSSRPSSRRRPAAASRSPSSSRAAPTPRPTSVFAPAPTPPSLRHARHRRRLLRESETEPIHDMVQRYRHFSEILNAILAFFFHRFQTNKLKNNQYVKTTTKF